MEIKWLKGYCIPSTFTENIPDQSWGSNRWTPCSIYYHRVGYEPAAEPGTQTVAVKLDGKPVPQSPLRVEVEPGVDLSKVNFTSILNYNCVIN